jgi:hypothetical protein
MLIWRGVATQHLATGLTDAEMHPLAIDANTLFTAKHWIVRFWDQSLYVEVIEMLAAHWRLGV